MTRLLPFPLASAGLLALWLTLNQTLSLGQILLGAVVAVVGGLVLTALEAPKTRIRQMTSAFRLAAMVFGDIIRSNIAVAQIILGLGKRERRSGFVDIPLELRNSYGLAMLACNITTTPGNLWVNFDAATGALTIHVLDLVDKSDWLRTIKGRYERLLLEIFS